MKSLHFIIYFIAIGFFSCQKEMRSKKHHCGEPCPKNQICTEEFRSLVITVQAVDGQPIALDSFYTIRLKDGVKFDLNRGVWEDSVSRVNGRYVYWSDVQGNNTKAFQQDVRFVGFKNGTEVVNKVMTVGNDCCHVYAIEPDPVVVVPINP